MPGTVGHSYWYNRDINKRGTQKTEHLIDSGIQYRSPVPSEPTQKYGHFGSKKLYGKEKIEAEITTTAHKKVQSCLHKIFYVLYLL